MQEEFRKKMDRAEEEAVQLLSSLYLMAGGPGGVRKVFAGSSAPGGETGLFAPPSGI